MTNAFAEGDNNAYEEKAERMAEQKLLFQPMRKWYLDRRNVKLQAEHGLFPSMWMELDAWDGWKASKKAFLKFQDTGDAEDLESWPAFEQITQAFLEDGDGAGDDAPKPRPRKKSRFSDRDATTKTNPGAHLTQEQQQELMLLQMQLRTLQERSMNFGAEFEKWSQDPDRANPPPIYGPDGKRANTPEVLFRQELQRERSELMEKISAIQPTAAAAMGDAPKRPTRKLYIPVKEFPNVCFMGLILGPRGNHHKRMERDTLCKIRIRGKGSLREGSRGKDQQRDLDDDKDDMHVWVEGPSEAHVQQAVDMIEPLLNPESAKIDELKEKHQTELAEINGTTRTEIYCHICGEKGHQQWECPAKQRSYAMANVRCALCGDTSHPTRDCALNKQQATAAAGADGMSAADGAAARVKVDSEFLDFMARRALARDLRRQLPEPGERRGEAVDGGGQLAVGRRHLRLEGRFGEARRRARGVVGGEEDGTETMYAESVAELEARLHRLSVDRQMLQDHRDAAARSRRQVEEATRRGRGPELGEKVSQARKEFTRLEAELGGAKARADDLAASSRRRRAAASAAPRTSSRR
ncbi:hypothetical protein JL721_5313 [Aureococcus anophagefferens]|nr:hypothetical protein JL721_5313 [Aureococcus anophagefferens]